MRAGRAAEQVTDQVERTGEAVATAAYSAAAYLAVLTAVAVSALVLAAVAYGRAVR